MVSPRSSGAGGPFAFRGESSARSVFLPAPPSARRPEGITRAASCLREAQRTGNPNPRA